MGAGLVTALVVIEAIVILLLALLVAGLLRSHADILRRLHALDGGEEPASRAEGLQIGGPRPRTVPDAVAGVDLAGGAHSVALASSRGMVLLAFLSSGCSTCRPFWEAFARGAEMPAPDVRPLIVTKDPAEESMSRLEPLVPDGVTTLMSSAAWDGFRIPVSPYFVLVDASRGVVVGEGAAASWDHVRDLLSQAMADADPGRSDTRRRSERTARSLDQAGIEPGDASLYRNPHEPDPTHHP